MAEVAGFHVIGVREPGWAEEGKSVQFQFVAPNGECMRFFVPLEKMSAVLFDLHTALEATLHKNAQRPGFDVAQYDARLGLKYFTVGHGYTPDQKPMVVLQIEMSPKMTTSFMLEVEHAKDIGTKLVATAEGLKTGAQLSFQ